MRANMSPGTLFAVGLGLLVMSACVSQTIDPPVVKKAVAPSYPLIAVASRVTAKLVFDVSIDQQGKVTDAQLSEVPPFLFREPYYEQIARRWEFAPDERLNVRKARIQFDFRLMPLGTPREQLGTIFLAPYQIEVSAEEPETVIFTDPKERPVR